MTTRFRSPLRLQVGQEISLGNDEAYHLNVVLRARSGTSVHVVDAEGRLFRAVVRTINPSVLQIEAELEGSSTTPDRVLECWVPLLKGGRTDGLIRQLTELGASKICVFLSERSEVRPNAPARTKQLERFRRLSDESTRQCRRTDRVAIENHGALPQDGPGFFLWEEGGAPLAEVMAGLDDDPIRVLVGPEGGLSASEASALEACGWRAVHLGGRILRAETAVLAAATLVIYGAQS